MSSAGDGSVKAKRKRDPNMTYYEKTLLIDLIGKYYSVLEDKKTDSSSVTKKNQALQILCEEFNSQSVTPRTAIVLKNIWKNLKYEGKKKVAEERQAQMKTGGGPAVTPSMDALTIKILELIQHGAVGLLNTFDSDGDFDNARAVVTKEGTSTMVRTVEVEEIPECSQATENTPLLSGDWSQYSSSQLRTPKTGILRELAQCDVDVRDNDIIIEHINTDHPVHPEDPSTSNTRTPQSSSGTPKRFRPLTSSEMIMKRGRTSSRRRPGALPTGNEALMNAKLEAIASAETYAAEEHLLNKHIKNEQLKHEQLNTKIKTEQLKQEEMKTALLELQLRKAKRNYLQKD